MAQALSIEQIRALPAQRYADVRDSLASGDLLFAAGNYLFSRLIRRMTHSAWSHVGIIYREPLLDRVLLLESVETFGVRFAPLSKYLSNYANGKPYDGEIAIARIRGLDHARMTAAMRFGLDQLADPYDRGQVYRVLGRVLLGRVARQLRRQDAFICSELVHECFLSGGADLRLGQASRGYVCPGDIWTDPRVELKFRLARQPRAVSQGSIQESP
ncbi:MAG: hypothetical protein JWR16_1339 [Nevskia sp.]|nr:hypothetical protein [Nevskia sp.]